MESPGKRRRDIRGQLSDLSKRMKAEREKIAREIKHWNLQAFPTLANTAVAVYILTECDPQPVCEFLAREGIKRGWDDLDNDNMLLLTLDLFLGKTAAELDALTNDEAPLDPTALTNAHAFAIAINMDAWTRTLNNQGVEVSTASVLDEARRKIGSVNPNVRPRLWGVPESGAARKRVHRWRKWRKGRFGRLREEEEDTQADMLEKAPYVQIMVVRLGPKPLHPLPHADRIDVHRRPRVDIRLHTCIYACARGDVLAHSILTVTTFGVDSHLMYAPPWYMLRTQTHKC